MPDARRVVTLAEAQSEIARLGGRLSGSRAYGTPRADSDWDYWLPERRVKQLLKWVIERGMRWESPFLGSFTFWPDGEQVEVSYLFPRTMQQACRNAKGTANG